MSTTSSVSSSSSLDSLVAAYEETLSAPVYALQTALSALSARQTALTELKTKLSTFSDTVDDFAVGGSSSPFLAYAVDSSDDDVVTAKAGTAAVIGTHSVKVNQLASYDTLLSDKVTSADDTGLTSGSTYSFTVKIGSNDAVTLSVTPSGTTYEDVMNAIVSAVNGDSTLGDLVTASVVDIDGTSSRLILTSTDSGSDNAITSVSGDFQSLFGYDDVDFTSRGASSTSSAGFMNSGTATDVLNAEITVDGVDLIRQSNTVSDAITGLKLNLLSAQDSSDSAITLTTSTDEDTVTSKIQEFIDNYNAVIEYLRDNVDTDSTTNERGVLANDTVAKALRTSIRSILGSSVSSSSSSDYTTLTSIGLKIASDGTLSIDDSTTLSDAITEDISAVSNLFTNSSGDGIADQLKDLLDTYTSTSGTLSSEQTQLQSKITYDNDRVTALQATIDKKGEAYRIAWAKVEASLSAMASTQSMLASLMSS